MLLNTENNRWYKAKVIAGNQKGQLINYPTINLDNVWLLSGWKRGVYATVVMVEKKIYKGMLYYGPRKVLQEKADILEIHLFDFRQNLYGETIQFQMKDFIRGVMDFSDMNRMSKQLDLDAQSARLILAETSQT